MKISETQKKILLLLDTSTESEIIEGIKLAKQDGNEQILHKLIELLNQNQENQIGKHIFEVLYNLNDKASSVNVILQFIKNEQYKALKPQLFSVLWQSSLNCSNYLLEIIELGLKSDYASMIEVLSIVESIAKPFDEQLVEQCIETTQEALLHKTYPDQTLCIELNKLLKDLLIS